MIPDWLFINPNTWDGHKARAILKRHRRAMLRHHFSRLRSRIRSPLPVGGES